MNVEYEIQKLRADLNNLQTAFLQSQRNASATVGKVDDTSNKVVAITPYTDVKTAYIGDTEVTFENVPQGNLSVYAVDSDDHYIDCLLTRVNDTLTVHFEYGAVARMTTVTISVQ